MKSDIHWRDIKDYWCEPFWKEGHAYEAVLLCKRDDSVFLMTVWGEDGRITGVNTNANVNTDYNLLLVLDNIDKWALIGFNEFKLK